MFALFGRLIDFMTETIVFLYGFVPSYGLAIILFTVLIRLLLLPLMIKQTKSMKAMQELQPQMQEIKDKYDDNKEKQQEEMMKLYQENNVNPLSGCLPLVIQMAIIIPLYRAIMQMSETVPEFEESVFLWIGRITGGSLAERDIVLVILTGLVMLGHSKMTQSLSGGGGKAGMMMYFMPLFIVFIGFQLPAAVMLYLFTSTLFQFFQQYYVKREPDEPETAVEEA
ncbi:YidC/Oxa1 family membrane protein insertase [Halarsenatibacter silvermanii]|uniref:YidC/Oxa1 family membrane protein insertase n=1 Tax=Halarsenatibacter silvermanii TaxID=321763 RepID=A0A1G9Q5L8_9FIRM|nr:YidC/Oxa1 family membrane protein insertase [Halarsenatibacter silvermanii]SDM06320.1 YidC/Oxa1 family membrane protein insertase [Halarsenatibacter silvermanii]